MSYDKPFKTWSQQLSILKSRNIIIDDDKSASDVLSLISYHTLVNGYKDLYEQNTDVFMSEVTIDTLFITHLIYQNINTLLLKYILIIEKSLKSKLGYTIAKNFGVETDTVQVSNSTQWYDLRTSSSASDYLSTSHYVGSNKNNILQKIIITCKKPYNDTLVHYYCTNKNHLPPWIVANDLSFGKTHNWYSILKSTEKNLIIDMFFNPSFVISIDEKKELFDSGLKQMKEYRDIVAHGNKTTKICFKAKLPKSPILKLTASSDILTEDEFMMDSYCKDDLFGLIVMMLTILNNKTLATMMIHDIYNTCLPYVSSEFAGKSLFSILNLPEDIWERLGEFMITHYNITIPSL